jgi:hypothetical protein
MQEVVDTTRHQNHELDERCAHLGRDPAQLRRSLVMWAPLDPWAAPGAFERIVESFGDVGISEFIVMWPPEDKVRLLDRVAATIASLRKPDNGHPRDPKAGATPARITRRTASKQRVNAVSRRGGVSTPWRGGA